jgi:D-beta-D-heptose 7-phosphate kinase/D-beta-D-heptose 1-phosphate adenosyltransferase
VSAPLLPLLDGARARAILEQIAGKTIVVVGDVMLDQFLFGHVGRISPEAPVPVITYSHEQHRAGGAANVALNARTLGAVVELIGVVGEDDAANKLKDLLRAAEIPGRGLVTDVERRTTAKVRIATTRNQQVARMDYEDDNEIASAIEEAVIRVFDDRVTRARAVVISDYLKGVVTKRVASHVIGVGRASGIPVLVDPKNPHLDYYEGATLVTPNHHEAETATHQRIRSDEDARKAAHVFRERARCEAMLLTRGEQGMWLSHDTAEGHLPALAREVADVTGAGDTVIATLALAVAGGASWAEAAQLANQAAGIVVGKFGPATVTPAELLAHLHPR